MFLENLIKRNSRLVDCAFQLHREGKSIREISKSLGLGQGEVKLVIDLFRDTK